MDYAEFTDWMFNLERFGIKLGLDNITELLSRCGNPHKSLRSVHVTGTNGKGSVCAFISKMLTEHQMKVGLYTSPHLVDFGERIKVGDKEIPQADVLRIGLRLKKIADEMASEDREKQLTFFEFTTGLAFQYFKEESVDILVAEVGMGGRLDATNVLSPDVCVITRIGLEHTNYLGSTVQDIAREKAGIIKPGVPVVTCEQNQDALSVIAGTCRKKGSRLIRFGEDFTASGIEQSIDGTAFDYEGMHKARYKTKLLGGYQAENAAAALAVVDTLHDCGIHVTPEEMRDGVMRTRWPGRLEVVSRKPLVIFDGSHNPDGASTTSKVLSDLGVVPLTIVLGCMDDKDAAGIVKALGPISARMICTKSRYKRALPATRLAEIAGRGYDGPVDVVEVAESAFEEGLMSTRGVGMCVIGSLYLVGEAIPWWTNRKVTKRAPHKV